MAAENPSERAYHLAEVSVPRLLFELLSQRFSGQVVVEHAGKQSSAGFCSGLPRWCRHDLEGSLLGEILAELGVVDAEAIVSAVEVEDGRRLGEKLIGQHGAKAEVIREGLRLQCERRLTRLCGAAQGRIVVVAGSPDNYPDYPEAEVLPVILEGVLQHFDEAQVDVALGGLDTRRVVAKPALAKYLGRFRFADDQVAALASLPAQGGVPFDAWQADSALDHDEARRILAALQICQMVGEPDAGAPAMAPDEEQSEPPSKPSSAPTSPGPMSKHALSTKARRRPAGMPAEGPALADYLRTKWDADADPYELLAVSDDANLATIEAEVARLGRAVGDEADVQALLEEISASARRHREKVCGHDGPIALREKNWKQAVAIYEDLLQFLKGDVPTRVSLAWARYQSSTRSQREAQRALDALERFLQEDDAQADIHYYRGYLLLELDKSGAAMRAFENAVELDPSNVDAARQVRALKSGKAPRKATSSGKQASEAVAEFKPKKGTPRHRYWSGIWPTIWVGAGIVVALMIAAQFVLRLDLDF